MLPRVPNRSDDPRLARGTCVRRGRGPEERELVADLPNVTLHDIEITRGGKASGSRRGAPAPSDQLTLNLTAKTYRYLDEGEAGAPAADDEKGKGKKGGKTRREQEKKS